MTKQARVSSTDSAIRVFSLIRKLGSIFVVSMILIFVAADVYHGIHRRFLVDDLKDLADHGESMPADVNEEYEITTIGYKRLLTFTYSFTVAGEMYKDKYTFTGNLPQDQEQLKKIFTVHYLKDAPATNTLNVADELIQQRKEVADSSMFWLIAKIFLVIVLCFLLLYQLVALVAAIKDMNKPIEVPEYLKKK